MSRRSKFFLGLSITFFVHQKLIFVKEKCLSEQSIFFNMFFRELVKKRISFLRDLLFYHSEDIKSKFNFILLRELLRNWVLLWLRNLRDNICNFRFKAGFLIFIFLLLRLLQNWFFFRKTYSILLSEIIEFEVCIEFGSSFHNNINFTFI